MNLLKQIKKIIKKILKIDNIKLIESPKIENKNLNEHMSGQRTNLIDSLKVNSYTNNTNGKKVLSNNFSDNKVQIDVLECLNDGLGFIKIKKY